MSIRSPQARKWLEQAYPAGWEHQPYLVTVDGDRVEASAGTGMALRLGWLLGPRQAWRVWNLARQYGVVWPAGEEFSAERRGFLKRAALFVGGLFFFPRFGAPSGQGQARGRPRHPFEGIRIKNSRKLEGTEKAQAVQQALDSQDMQNVLGETGVAADMTEAIAFYHELEGENSLLTVSFLTPQSFLGYYQLAHPVGHYATWAFLYVGEDGVTARLVSLSVNGRTVAFSGRAGASLESHCSNSCAFPYFDYDCDWCNPANPDPICWNQCCDQCLNGCGGDPICEATCYVYWCHPWCDIWCCDDWVHTCCACGP